MFIFFFCQLSVNEADGLSADADVHLNSEAYGKQAGARGQERGRYGELPRGPAALLPGPSLRPGPVHHPRRVLGRRAFSQSARAGFCRVVLFPVPC